jgi:hypothetical protein
MAKEGDPIEKLLHESGEDIFISYRTGIKVQVKDGKIVKFFDYSNHHEMNWKLKEWRDQEKAKEIQEEKRRLADLHRKNAKKVLKREKTRANYK